jgi:hypothetical protein
LLLRREIGVAFLAIDTVKIVSTDTGTALQVGIEIYLDVIWVRL